MTREDINDIISAICPNDEDYEKPCISPKYLRQELEQLALDQKQWNGELITKNNLAVDKLISDCEKMSFDIDFFNKPLKVIALDAVKNIVNDLPSVTPQEPKKGHWIDERNDYGEIIHWHCSNCYDDSGYTTTCKWDYCPNCGSDNREVKQKPRWIPVSERLPEPDVEVLVTDDAGGLATISTDSIYESEATGEKEWYISQRVTAWMPLPEPYKEVEK